MIHHTSAAIALLTNRSRGGILIDPAMLDGRAPVVSQVYEQCVCAGESPRQRLGRDHAIYHNHIGGRPCCVGAILIDDGISAFDILQRL